MEGKVNLVFALVCFIASVLGLIQLEYVWCLTVFVCWLLACLTSQHGLVYLRDRSAQFYVLPHWDQTFYLTQSQYTDTRPTSPSTCPISPGTCQGSHWSASTIVWLDLGKSCHKWNSNLWSSALEVDSLTTRPTRRWCLTKNKACDKVPTEKWDEIVIDVLHIEIRFDCYKVCVYNCGFQAQEHQRCPPEQVSLSAWPPSPSCRPSPAPTHRSSCTQRQCRHQGDGASWGQLPAGEQAVSDSVMAPRIVHKIYGIYSLFMAV